MTYYLGKGQAHDRTTEIVGTYVVQPRHRDDGGVFLYTLFYDMFFVVKNNMNLNLMKLARCLLGAFGFSTFHLHNNLPLNSQSLSKVIPTISNEDLLGEVEKQHRESVHDAKFSIIQFGKGDDFPTYVSDKKNKMTWTRAPRSITSTRTPRYHQSKNRRR